MSNPDNDRHDDYVTLDDVMSSVDFKDLHMETEHLVERHLQRKRVAPRTSGLLVNPSGALEDDSDPLLHGDPLAIPVFVEEEEEQEQEQPYQYVMADLRRRVRALKIWNYVWKTLLAAAVLALIKQQKGERSSVSHETKAPSIAPSPSPSSHTLPPPPSLAPSPSPSDNQSQKKISHGSQTLINTLLTDDGHIIVVETLQVQKLASSGEVLAVYSSPREILVAAIDDEYVVLADFGMLVTLNLSDLSLRQTRNLAQQCFAGVMLAGHRFVCGPDNDWDRIFTVYDVLSGVKFSVSGKYTYNGLPMRIVPGLDMFVTVSVESSPSDFHLYNATTGAVTYSGESPYHGAFQATLSYAFWGNPATHLINSQGIMLRIFEPGTTMCGGYDESTACFVRDGELGSVSHSESYAQMTQDKTAQNVYGLIDKTNDGAASLNDYNSFCREGCTLHQVDISNRIIKRETTVVRKFSSRPRPKLIYDEVTDSVIIAGSIAGEDGYEIWRIGFEE